MSRVLIECGKYPSCPGAGLRARPASGTVSRQSARGKRERALARVSFRCLITLCTPSLSAQRPAASDPPPPKRRPTSCRSYPCPPAPSPILAQHVSRGRRAGGPPGCAADVRANEARAGVRHRDHDSCPTMVAGRNVRCALYAPGQVIDRSFRKPRCSGLNPSDLPFAAWVAAARIIRASAARALGPGGAWTYAVVETATAWLRLVWLILCGAQSTNKRESSKGVFHGQR